MEQNFDQNLKPDLPQTPKKFPTWAIVVLTVSISVFVVGTIAYFTARMDKVETFSKTIIFEDNIGTPRDSNTQLFSYNLETGARKQLTDSSIKDIGGTYSVATHLLAYNKLIKEGVVIPGDCYPGQDTSCTPDEVQEEPQYQLQIIDVDTNKLVMQSDTGYTPVFSLDGKKLAYFTKDKHIVVLDLVQRTKKSLSSDFIPTDNDLINRASELVWDRDNINLYFLNDSIYKINSSDGKISTLYKHDDRLYVLFKNENRLYYKQGTLKLTLDGNSLAFIFKVNDPSLRANLYTNWGDDYLAIFNIAQNKLDTYLLESNKSRSARYLAGNGTNEVENFVISPDNSKVYFEATDETSPGINIFYLKNGNRENISDNAGFLLGFGKDANQLITRKIDDGIYSLDVSTKKLQKLTPINPVF